ncbi:MAG TPA: YdcF family protein [Cyanobacteria bacterium UBA12227]|nr:YdcF family protein [Cyanobacteria bacterium UBA12227]HAX85483.1 YdcF family protein [Cyanobacteria bacterium UBA11370]HBY79632.1 YdcF family protein [Cyanobacteria bacterium UBA11148]
MFELLSQVLLWLLITVFLYNLFKKFIPKEYFTLVGALFLFAVIVSAFFFPNNQVVSAIWNVLSFPLKPVGASIVLLSLALRQGLGDKSKNQVVAALLILLLSSLPIFSNLLAASAEQQAFTRQEAEAQSAAAIVVLGQGTTEPNQPPRTQIQLTDTGDRILYAAQLYRESGNEPLVIVSAGSRPNLQGNSDEISEARDVRTVLTQLGVPESRIVESRATDLRSSAEAVERILRDRRLANDPIFLVTSAYNSRRARQTFSNVGLTNVIAKPTGFFMIQSGARPKQLVRIDDFIPSVEALTVTTRVVEEFLTSVYYYLRGWLAVS